MVLLIADSSPTVTQYIGLILLVVLLYPAYLFLDYSLFQPYRRHRLLAAQGIRGPLFIPFIGSLPRLGWYYFHDRVLDWAVDVVKQYGLISRHERGPINVLQLQDIDYVLAVWKTQAQHYRRGSVLFSSRTTVLP